MPTEIVRKYFFVGFRTSVKIQDESLGAGGGGLQLIHYVYAKVLDWGLPTPAWLHSSKPVLNT
jgi:hypothetical protein